MFATRCTGLPHAAAEGPKPGHQEGASDCEFVGRTSAQAPGRALVPTALPCSGPGPTISQRSSAAFLTQLIATAQQVPQTRARRRAEPADASTAYAETVARCIDVGGTVCRAMWA
jgi:hypothetical protein